MEIGRQACLDQLCSRLPLMSRDSIAANHGPQRADGIRRCPSDCTRRSEPRNVEGRLGFPRRPSHIEKMWKFTALDGHLDIPEPLHREGHEPRHGARDDEGGALLIGLPAPTRRADDSHGRERPGDDLLLGLEAQHDEP